MKCEYNGREYPVKTTWEIGLGCLRGICICIVNRDGTTKVDCIGGCPHIPDQLVPTSVCPNPKIVPANKPCTCPAVSCRQFDSSRFLCYSNLALQWFEVSIGRCSQVMMRKDHPAHALLYPGIHEYDHEKLDCLRSFHLNVVLHVSVWKVSQEVCQNCRTSQLESDFILGSLLHSLWI